MKYIFALLLFCHYPMYSQTEFSKLYANLSSELTIEPQTVYWFSLKGYEYDILDSCYLEKGTSSFEMKAALKKDDFLFSTWLSFSKNGPKQIEVVTMAGETMRLNISKDTGLFPKIDGCLASEENHEELKTIKRISKKIKSLRDLLIKSSDSLIVKQLSDSIDFYTRYIKIDQKLLFLSKTNSPQNFYTGIVCLENYLPSEKMDSLIKEMKQRFPENKVVQEFDKNRVFPPSSAHSDSIQLKELEILAYRTNTKVSDWLSPKKNTQKVSGIEVVKLGDKVENFSLISLKDSSISIVDIQTPYILLDFWASWCGPCRMEFPHQKEALKAFGNSLTIYAISMDSNRKAWKEAIRFDKTEIFTHVFLESSISDSITTKFGITTIPANFLLDKNRKIIAVNLRGDALLRKMKEMQLEHDK